MQVHNISFGAKLLDTATIQKNICGGRKIPHDVALVELDAHSYNDLKSIEDIVFPWGGLSSLTLEIYDKMSAVYENPPHINNGWYFYALTNQKNGYEKLDSKAILSIAQVTDTNSGNNKIKINYFETNEKYNYYAKKPKFSQIGTALVNGIKKIYPNKNIVLTAIDDAIPFWEKNGFKRVCEGCSDFVFNRKI